MVRVSLHVCSRDRFTELYGMLVSLYSQSFQDWDLILIDESDQSIASFKPLRDILTRFRLDGHGVKLIRHEGSQRQGICHARNAAIKADDWNDVFIRIDDDTVCDKNYLKLLVDAFLHLKEKGINVAAVGGTVPLFGDAITERNPEKVKPIFNKITYKNERFEIGDDGGVTYESDDVIESHHLRSSFLFTREATAAVGGYTEMLGSVSGFREETDFGMKLRAAGYLLFTVPAAKAWHLHTPSGGVRSNPQAYAPSVALNEEFFQRKWKRLLKLGKLPVGFCEGI